MKNKVIKELMGLRAVFYARVSTEEEMQVNALSKQIQENRDVIKEKGWILVDEYIDEGKSGTKIHPFSFITSLFSCICLDRAFTCISSSVLTLA